MNVFIAILETVSSAAVRQQFQENDNLVKDISYLVPQNFTLCQKGIPGESMHPISEHAEVDRDNPYGSGMIWLFCLSQFPFLERNKICLNQPI